MKVLFILTSHDQLGNTGNTTGFWLEEFASPYYVLKDAGVEVVLSSPKGGLPPVDPGSEGPDFQTEETRRFKGDTQAQAALANTVLVSDINVDHFDGIFYPGGHGPMWDLYANTHSIDLIEKCVAAGKPVAAVCHGPSVLLRARQKSGDPVIKGKKVTGFSNSEEAAVGLTDVVPYSLEDQLKKKGGQYQKADDWASHIVVDGCLVTGQNPNSSKAVAEAFLESLQSLQSLK